MRTLCIWLAIGLAFQTIFIFNSKAQNVPLDTQKALSYALEGDIRSVLDLIDVNDSIKLSPKDSTFKHRFEERFKYPQDRSDYLDSRRSSIDNLLVIYRDYWRLSLLDTSAHDDELKKNLTKFLAKNYTPAKNLTADSNNKVLSKYLKNYIKSLGYHSTGYGNTGRFKDLLVWKTEKDTTYNFKVNDEKIRARVILMDDFITLGWSEYATLDKMHPGGWATKEKLFCVKKSYDLNSESFLVSYLAHEGRHFSDYRNFPELGSTDLEYRAKLTELSMAQETLFTLIQFFIANADYNSDNGHQVANYCAIRDLSEILFDKEFEEDIEKWKTADVETINNTALTVLIRNTQDLEKAGKKVKLFIK